MSCRGLCLTSTCHQLLSWLTCVGSVEILTSIALKMGCSRAILISLGLMAIAVATVASQENWMSFYTRFVLYSLSYTYAGCAQITRALATSLFLFLYYCWFRQENCADALDKGDDGDRRPEPNLNNAPGRAVQAYKVSSQPCFQFCSWMSFQNPS